MTEKIAIGLAAMGFVALYLMIAGGAELALEITDEGKATTYGAGHRWTLALGWPYALGIILMRTYIRQAVGK